MGGIAISVLIVLELCAGSAGLSCAVRDAGFDACPIDHKFNKHKPKMPIANFDLSSPFGQNYVLELLNSEQFLLCISDRLAVLQVGQEKNLCHAGLRIEVLKSLNHYAAKPSRVASEAFRA